MGYYENKKNELEELLKLIRNEKNTFEDHVKLTNNELNRKSKDIEFKEKGINQLAKERQTGFPRLAQAYEELFSLPTDNQLIEYLLKKKHPAPTKSNIVKEQTRLRREAEKKAKIAEYLVKFYENMVPSLVDLKEEIDIEDEEENRELLKDYTEEELKDRATHYLSKEEYRRLPSVERNQIALDAFKRRHQSPAQIGKLYERYIGYLYEKDGYKVKYQGIEEGFEDLGRDLICTKDNKVVLIQCKNWASWKTIFEKHIFQFFGTVFEYKYNNPGKDITGVFVTSTNISPLAKTFAEEFKNELKLELKENKKYDRNYPCIKCNISRTNGDKIYHLPFDQQYDNVLIEPEMGEFYCTTVREAEEKGFRRAYRRHNNT